MGVKEVDLVGVDLEGSGGEPGGTRGERLGEGVGGGKGSGPGRRRIIGMIRCCYCYCYCQRGLVLRVVSGCHLFSLSIFLFCY